MKNLKKENKSDDYDNNEPFLSEKFNNIDLKALEESKRIFIPYSKLPKDDEQRHLYLKELTVLIEQKTGKHYSYFFVNENEPYEVSGIYIQIAPELKDKNGEYVNNNDYVYDKNGTKWHVIYYYNDNQNQPCILIDNDTLLGYRVVTSLNDFTLNPPEIIKEDVKKNNKNKTFNVGKVALAILIGAVGIVIITLFLANMPDIIVGILGNTVDESKEASNFDINHFISGFGGMLLRALPILIFIKIIFIAWEILTHDRY